MAEAKVVAVSNAQGEVTQPQLLRAAERVHRQLRPHLADYAGRMREVLAGGAEMAVALVEGEVAGVAVFRVLEKTHSGRDLYCDDLVTDESRRSTGVGRALVRYMEALARERACDTFSLDSGCQRQQAHKFYFREGMTITSFHFDKKISAAKTGIRFS
ncbi:MAG TPA: GNAT family N-acetyltransferase [Usitatibacter sp.]|nr:GNAT family N-acetyltransferase [Usitatibacter sp.]